MPFASSAEELAAEREPDLRRSRSHGHGNFWDQQQARERYERELQIQRRGVNRRHRAGPSLTVPNFQYGPHQPQQSSRYDDQWEEERFYVRTPSAPRSTELPIRTSSRRRPSIKVEIHQDKLSRSSSPPPSYSPTTGTSLVDLRLQVNNIATKLADVSALCSRKHDGDADSSKGLSFGSIAAQVNGDAFRLKIWSYEVGLEKWTEIDASREKHVETALRTMQRISNRASDLKADCARARYRDLTIPSIETDLDLEEYDSNDENESLEDPTESLGFEIQSCLNSISLQIQTLSRLTRALQDATCPNGVVNEEMTAINGLVAEVDDFFGSPEALKKHSIDEKFAGRKALEEARYTARLH
ncbi:uncharacterized protein BDZ99DRAFT_495783 [Mytilinidion resinicola]|uniref:Uncharacterized protein n=1 Tax=Mytilinidion resinicola TaxID=574789 RepID=A0A6A6Z250_9PEZI|nr:uncharacterized protein BDZ99DRAFT_495783 [Mytilinidion resinicola]KAF2814265.1 hypothetical protein BDZ99DRAFT_495783 [Mytilinidion resinicola]